MDTDVALEVSGCTLHGSLLLPDDSAPVAAALIHPGSGPTDRDGNSRLGLQTDAYRLLAAELASHGIASLRIDKRGIGKSVLVEPEITALTIHDYAADTRAWMRFLGDRLDCSSYIIGHSEGGLIALLAARERVRELKGLVLLSVSSQPFDELVLGQIKGKVSDDEFALGREALARLAMGDDVVDVPSTLASLFHPTVQAYIRSRLPVKPQALAQSIDLPMAVIGGSADLQVNASDSKRLANPSAAVPFIEIAGMTHTLKQVVSAASDQSAEYTDRTLPLAPTLVERIAGFIVGQS